MRIIFIFLLLIMTITALPSRALGIEPDSPEQVELLQMGLALLDYDPGIVDGILGPDTRKALRAFQLDHALEAHGEPDGTTLWALQNELALMRYLREWAERTAERIVHGIQDDMAFLQQRGSTSGRRGL